MASLRKRGRVWYYRFSDADGVKREEKGCSDKRATEELARAAESEAARQRAGLIDPKARRMAEAARRPIGEHVDEFIASMASANRNAQHIAQTRTYIERILTLARIERTPDLAPSAVMVALGKLGDEDFSARSINAHATAVKSLSRWLWRDGRTSDYALNAVTKLNETTDRRRIRRVLTPEELMRLIEATRPAPPWRGLPGEDRVTLYAVAASTGFRRDELRSLTPASFRLDGDPPTIVCEASYTKNHQEAEQPIPESLAIVLRPWLASKAPGRPVFHPLSQKTGLMLAKDLERAGIKPVDDQGRVVDMHSLRHGYITTLAKAGVPVKTLQTLARHSDPKLTLNVYSHLTLFDTAAALDALPDLTPGKNPQSEPLAMTGTDPISKLVAHHLPTGGDGNGRDVSDSDVMSGSGPRMMMDRNSLEMPGFDASGRDVTGVDGRVGDGIRTLDIQIGYLVTGSMATITFGEPRFTNDIDVVIDLQPEQVEAFCDAFPETDFYVSREAIREAIRNHRMFNIIHPSSGLKIDVIIPAKSEFERSRRQRGRLLPIGGGTEVRFASPEDVIVRKLEYFREGGPEKHLRDIAGVLKVQGDRIDRRYIAEWAGRMGVAEVWELVLQRVDNP